ncbi:MAG: efflux RND transporter periplasmic adaptor subunit [Bacteroidota bacterium]
MLPVKQGWVGIFFVALMGWFSACSQGNGFESIVTSQLERKEFLDIVTVSGTLEAIQSHSFACPRIWESITIQFLIPEGTIVSQGDTLCILKASEVENQYLQAVNELEKAKAEYNKTAADLALQYLILESLVKSIEASTKITRLDSVQMKFTSPSSREITRLELEKAELERDITLKKLKFLKQINDSELQKMKLKIKQQENRVDQAESKLNKLTITSTVDGCVIYEKLWSTGDKVREGDITWGNMPIVRIPDLQSMQVKLEVSEADYKRLANNQTMHITVDAFPEIELKGAVKFKAPVGKPVKEKSNVKLFEVTASLDSTSFTIQPGLGVTCDILVKSVQDTIVIPVVSLFDEDSAKVVYVADEMKFIRKEVSVSEYNNKEAIITEGLTGQERLALMKPPESLIH